MIDFDFSFLKGVIGGGLLIGMIWWLREIIKEARDFFETHKKEPSQ